MMMMMMMMVVMMMTMMMMMMMICPRDGGDDIGAGVVEDCVIGESSRRSPFKALN